MYSTFFHVKEESTFYHFTEPAKGAGEPVTSHFRIKPGTPGV